jgi:dephospho-CoA kinase
MLSVGLTGGIGSGKSAVADVFRALNVPVFVADDCARDLLSSDTRVKEQVIALFGSQAYLADGIPDRAFIADQAFRDANLLEQLNAIIHPVVRHSFEAWKDEWRGLNYVIQEAAILFESGGAGLMDENIVVWAPEEIRVQRVVARDQTSADQVRARMGHQWTDEKKVALAQFVIINDGGHSLIRQVLDIDTVLRHLNSIRDKSARH